MGIPTGALVDGRLMPSFLSISVDVSILLLLKLNAARRLKKPIIPASVQVAFSMVSVDWATPPSWLTLPNDESSPPPLEFCSNTIIISNIAAIVDIIINRVVIFKVLILNLSI